MFKKKITCLTKPNITIFNEKNIIIWQIECNKAKLNLDKTLNLYGYVYMNKIINNKNTQSIITHQVLINFINQSIVSNNITIIHSNYFHSIGSKMQTALMTNIIQLFNNIYTQYKIIKKT